MAKIITFYNHKGGVGKTSNTILTATNLQAHFKKNVAVIDADEGQWSTYRIYENQLNQYQENYKQEELHKMFKDRSLVEYPVFKSYINDRYSTDDSYPLNKLIEELKDTTDYIFLDLGNRSLEDFEYLFSKIDYFIIPFSRDPEELYQAVRLNSLLNSEFPDIQSYFLMVKITKSKTDLEEFEAVKSKVQKQIGAIFSTPILERRKYVLDIRSFFKPMNKNTEIKEEGKYSYFNFLKEFTKNIK